MTWEILLTARERTLIMRALKIACEDGSIFGAAETDAEIQSIYAEVEEIERKLAAS